MRWRLLPFLGLLYIVSYLDRVNVGFAKLTMNAAIGIDDAMYAFGAGIFFIGYFLFEVPSNLILERVGARRWIARILVTWGLISAGTALVTGPNSFLSMRFLLGLAEAGFFPGILLYLTYWFPAKERASVVGLFMVALPLGGTHRQPAVGRADAHQRAWASRGGNGCSSSKACPQCCSASSASPFSLMDPAMHAGSSPINASGWRRHWTLNGRRSPPMGTRHCARRSCSRECGHSRSRTSASCSRCTDSTSGCPSLISAHGVELRYTGWIAALPFLCGAPFMVWWGRHSDRTGERVVHLIIVAGLGFAGFAAASAFQSLAGQIAGLCLALMGVYGSLPVFWTLPTTFLTGTAAAAGLALINSLGNLAGYLGPQVVAWLTHGSGDFGPRAPRARRIHAGAGNRRARIEDSTAASGSCIGRSI